MPMYEYQCKNCEKKTDDLRSFADADKPGPECCGAPTERVFAAQGADVHFKGFGWPSKTFKQHTQYRGGR